MTLLLMRVADLGETTGIHVAVSAAGVEGNNEARVAFRSPMPRGVEERGPGRLVETWFESVIPASGRIELDVFVLPSCEPTPVDGDERFRSCGFIGRVDRNDPPERSFPIDLGEAGVLAGSGPRRRFEMSAESRLDLIDRATLVAWRASNLIKWAGAALAVAFALGAAFEATLSIGPDFSIHPSTPAGTFWFALRAVVPTALTGIAVGVIVGRRVYRYAMVVASFVALAHLALGSLFVFLDVPLSTLQGGFIVYAIEPAPGFMLAILEIFVSGVVARHTWERRPRALRGGSDGA